MALRTFNLPDPGEGLVEADIVTWRVAVGDTVAVNDIVVEIETAKSLVELPIPWAGTVAELLVDEGATVEVGTPIIRIEVAAPEVAQLPPGPDATASEGVDVAPSEGVDSAPAESPAAVPAETPAAAPAREPNLVGYGAVEGSSRRRARKGDGGSGRATGGTPDPRDAASPRPSQPAESVPPGSPRVVDAPDVPAGSGDGPRDPGLAVSGGSAPTSGRRPLAKPPVRAYAKDRGVDLASVPPSAPTGIISRADVDAYLADTPGTTTGTPSVAAATTPDAATTPAAAAAPAESAWPSYGDPEQREVRIPVKGVRKVTAEAMVASAFTAPHVTEFVTVDVTATKELMARLADDREFAGSRVTELLFVAKALLVACRRNPGVNATWDTAAGEIVQKRYVNLGIAAATPRGLMVPNIKDADRLTLRELADALTDLVVTAREGRTPPADMSGGTITITNVGVFGIDTGTPIINPGESAILAMGAIRRQPWVVEAPDGTGGVVERIEPRWVTQLALSFDHRLIDGDLGSRFLADVAAVLHDPARGLVWG